MFLADWIDRVNGFLGRLVSYAIWIGMVVVVYEVVMRYAFNAPTVWAQGYAQRIFAGYFILIGAYTLIQRGHVRVDLLLGAASTRRRALLDIINYSVLLIWMAALTYEGWFYLHDAWQWGERDDGALGHPMWPVKLALLIGVAMMALQGLAELMRSVLRLIDPARAGGQP
ncbi:MAG: TRAP transporter small permease subunit [Pararhodobacter sp.]|nr:TRAP transporter small permease subunit [Pararhodobacter sp.]